MGLAKALILVNLCVLLLSTFTAYGEDHKAVAPVLPRHHGIYAHPGAAPSLLPTHGGHHHRFKLHPHPPTAAPAHSPDRSPAPATAHHHAHPPSHTPAPAPKHRSPVHPPAYSPAHVKPPTYAPKKPFPRSFVAVQGVVLCKLCKYSGVDNLNNATGIKGATVKLQCNNTKYPLMVKGTTDKNGYFFIAAPKTITTYGAHKCKVFVVSTPTTACSKITALHGGLTGAVLNPTKPFISEKKKPFLLYTVGPFALESKCPPR